MGGSSCLYGFWLPTFHPFAFLLGGNRITIALLSKGVFMDAVKGRKLLSGEFS
ncbi:hypothetical protein M0L20_02645 [Spirosoma sp. RP8]|uniref:Uncharacterized protein n=1 Tax=Spirosoma liriopis TaxID=2937440 RepID=A0ABT0HFS9_9BACT|nr:hypothetical protein [Spirosoma liriopis]MCK8490732.1 hypothetical protein [Spirosoma liriopis]